MGYPHSADPIQGSQLIMANVLDTAILLGKEVTYGTPVTLTHAYEGKADLLKRSQERIESVGFQAGLQGKRSDRIVTVNMGGDGSLEFDILNKGFSFILQAMLGSISGPTQIDATSAYKATAATTADDPADSYTVQVQKNDTSGTQRNFTYHGSTITGWSITQDVGGLLVASLNLDFEDVDTITSAGTPAYPDAASPFDWTQTVATLDGDATDISSFSLDVDLALKTDRRFLRGSELKKRPCRMGVPQFTGAMAMEFEDLTIYDDFVAGSVLPIVITWTGAVIDSPEVFEFVITMPACQYTGETPEASLSDVPKQAIPYEAMWNGTDPVVTIEVTSTDTAL